MQTVGVTVVMQDIIKNALPAAQLQAGKYTHFFEPETLIFFASRVSVYGFRVGQVIHFATTEKGPNGIRRATVRVLNLDTVTAETAQGCTFQQYPTMRAALAQARRMAEKLTL